MLFVIIENDHSWLKLKLELNLNKNKISKSGLWLKNKSWMHVMYVALELVLLEAKQRNMDQENTTVPSAEPWGTPQKSWTE